MQEIDHDIPIVCGTDISDWHIGKWGVTHYVLSDLYVILCNNSKLQKRSKHLIFQTYEPAIARCSMKKNNRLFLCSLNNNV